jgi:propionyl-CoA carboxylase alpha chain
MVRAIDDFKITGCETTLPFCRWAIQHEAFVSGNFDTHFVKKYFTPEVLKQESDDEMEIAAMAAVHAYLRSSANAPSIVSSSQKRSKWKTSRAN